MTDRPEVPLATSFIYSEIQRERDRQDAKFPDQHLPDGTGPDMPVYTDREVITTKAVADVVRARTDAMAAARKLTWRYVLQEEFWEACAEDDQDKLRAELVQVAAVAVRWIEDIDRRHKEGT